MSPRVTRSLAAKPVPKSPQLQPSPVLQKRKRGAVSDGGESSDLTGISSSDEGEESDALSVQTKTKGSPKKRAARKPKPKANAEGDEGEGDVFTPKKTRKPRAPKPEPVYVIPDVEKKTTMYNGRLGYACLNTILRNKKPAKDAIFCSRTCRIDSIKKNGIEWVKELGRKNVEDLLVLIQWNVDNNIFFMRMSSEMFPFASHPEYGYSLEYCSDLLSKVGVLADKHNHRLTTHPGQFTQLGSPNPKVRASSIKELQYHCEMMERMGIGKDGVTIVHGGGVYNDKPATLVRIRNTIENDLPQNVRDRLVLENDEICYSAEDLLPICEDLDIPLVFDYHHDSIQPSSIPPSEIIARANAIFARRGIRPKQHLSEPRPGAVTIMERRAHSDRCENLPVDLPDDMDLMIEAKDKEQAVLHLFRMYDLQPVIHASLRPPDENPTKETKGRKSAKSAKAKKAKLALEEDGASAEDEIEDEVVVERKARTPRATKKAKMDVVVEEDGKEEEEEEKGGVESEGYQDDDDGAGDVDEVIEKNKRGKGKKKVATTPKLGKKGGAGVSVEKKQKTTKKKAAAAVEADDMDTDNEMFPQMDGAELVKKKRAVRGSAKAKTEVDEE